MWGALVIFLGGAEGSMCGVPPCTPQNCTGCCDEAEGCHAGDEVGACGLQGAACVSCLPGTCAGDGLCFGTGSPPDAADFDASLTFPDGGRRDAGAADAGANDAGSGDAGEVDSGTPDAGPADAGGDAGFDAGLDAGVDAGVDAGRPDAGNVPGIRFANFSNRTLDFCVWNGAPPAQAAFHPTGIAPGEVSDYFPFAGLVVNSSFLLVPPGVGCVTDAGFNVTMMGGNSTRHRSYWYTGTGSPLAGSMLEDVALNPGGDVVLFTRMLSSSAALTFTPFDDGGIDAGPISIVPGTATLVPGGLVGVFTGNVPGQGVPPARPFASVDGGLVRVFVTGSAIVVCDNLAPPVGILSDCRTTVRAP